MLEKLKAIQQREKLTDGGMAEQLGISRSAWNLIRNERMALSGDVAITAAGVWPELTRDLIDRAEQAALSAADSRAMVSSERGAA